MANHAKLSPSSSARWLTCPASAVMEVGKPNTTSEYAAEGTAAHYLAEQSLLGNEVSLHLTVTARGEVLENHRTKDAESYSFTVDSDMAEYVSQYTSLVRSVQDATNGELLVEQRLSLEAITGEKGAKGTADAVIISVDEVVVIDLKYGQGVQVEAEENTQLMMYGLAALQTFDFTGDLKTVRMIICQPRRHHTSEWSIEAEELKAWGEKVKQTAKLIQSLDENSDLNGLFKPSESACKWCKASAECRPYAEFVHKTIMEEFITLQSPLRPSEAKLNNEMLALMFERLELIKAWVKTIEGATFERLTQGEQVGEFKLVQGRSGARRWSLDNQAEAKLKEAGLEDDSLFKKKLISPTDAERLAKSGKLSQDDWQTLQDLIVKPEGKPVIAPGHDKREAINPIAIFEDLTN